MKKQQKIERTLLLFETHANKQVQSSCPMVKSVEQTIFRFSILSHFQSHSRHVSSQSYFKCNTYIKYRIVSSGLAHLEIDGLRLLVQGEFL